MSNFIRSITRYVNLGVDIIFIGYPMRTALGILFGLFMKVILKIFSPALSGLPYIDLLALSEWECVVFGISIFHIRTVAYQIRNNSVLGENVEKAFEIIRTGKTSGYLTEWQIRNMYSELIQKVLENVELKDKIKEEVQNRLG